VNIHNQCSDFKLTSQRLFNTSGYRNEQNNEIDAGSMNSIGLALSCAEFGGVIT
jgi:hypothetical protein